MLAEAVCREGVEGVVGTAPCMGRVRRRLRQLAVYDVSVLISGESGTGKELAARTIHSLSARRDGPFVGVNCAAIHESLQESELFGHEAGAFTGAGKSTLGVLRSADGGTILLDEVGDMSPSLQSKFLRVLEERAVIPVGGCKPVPVDVRVLSATHRDLEADVAAGGFREDLYYRLNVARVTMPPLRDRPEDIPELAEHLLARICDALAIPPKRFSPEAIETLTACDWPGNVRQLGNAVQRACVLSEGSVIRPRDLWDEPQPPRGGGPGRVEPLETVVAAHVGKALRVSGGVRTRAAEMLGVSRKTLYRMIDRYHLA